MFRLRESSREADEDSGAVEVRVGVANQRYLASPITLVLTPKVALEDFTSLPNIRPFARANNSKV